MPHSDHSSSPPPLLFVDLPPFPDTVPTAPLLRISLSRLLQQDPEEEERCWKACCELGFFYLDLRTSTDERTIDGEGLVHDVGELLGVMKGFFDLEVADKVKYDFKDQGSYFGYKGYGEGYIDKSGTRDRNEFYNISKDDILGLSPPLPSPTILDPHRDLYASYIQSSHAICNLVIALLSRRLQIPTLESLHALEQRSGDQIRFVKAPPQEIDRRGISLGEHTDFGSVTVLFNQLGGLQVKLPDGIDPIPPSSITPTVTSDTESKLCQDGWTYVRPLPGHAIINLGDALVKFSAGILRSNIHRVVAPPGEQSSATRYSLVYFCRPGDEVVLKSLVGDVEGEEEVTAKAWILRRALGRREKDGWERSKGTEGAGGMRV